MRPDACYSCSIFDRFFDLIYLFMHTAYGDLITSGSYYSFVTALFAVTIVVLFILMILGRANYTSFIRIGVIALILIIIRSMIAVQSNQNGIIDPNSGVVSWFYNFVFDWSNRVASSFIPRLGVDGIDMGQVTFGSDNAALQGLASNPTPTKFGEAYENLSADYTYGDSWEDISAASEYNQSGPGVLVIFHHLEYLFDKYMGLARSLVITNARGSVVADPPMVNVMASWMIIVPSLLIAVLIGAYIIEVWIKFAFVLGLIPLLIISMAFPVLKGIWSSLLRLAFSSIFLLIGTIVASSVILLVLDYLAIYLELGDVLVNGAYVKGIFDASDLNHMVSVPGVSGSTTEINFPRYSLRANIPDFVFSRLYNAIVISLGFSVILLLSLRHLVTVTTRYILGGNKIKNSPHKSSQA